MTFNISFHHTMQDASSAPLTSSVGPSPTASGPGGVSGTSGTTSGQIPAVPASNLSSGFKFVPFAGRMENLGRTDTFQDACLYSLRPIRTAKQLYSVVELYWIKLTIISAVAQSANTLSIISRYGVGPRGLVASVGSGSTVSSVGHLYPRFSTAVSGSTLNSVQSTTWGQRPGDTPFPPGLQLDFNATEFRFNYVTPYIFNISPFPSSTNTVAFYIYIEGEVRCSGDGFGLIPEIGDEGHVDHNESASEDPTPTT